MVIGLGIVLILIGAVLEWAVQVDIPYVSQYTLGWILMIVGAIAIVISLIVSSQHRNVLPPGTTTTTTGL